MAQHKKNRQAAGEVGRGERGGEREWVKEVGASSMAPRPRSSSEAGVPARGEGHRRLPPHWSGSAEGDKSQLPRVYRGSEKEAAAWNEVLAQLFLPKAFPPFTHAGTTQMLFEYPGRDPELARDLCSCAAPFLVQFL